VPDDLQPRALLLADHPALELLNSTFAPRGEAHELIGDGRAFLTWLVDTGFVTEPDAARLKRRLGAQKLDEIAREVRAFRSWATEWIDRWRSEPDAPYDAELRRLNALLHQAHDFGELERAGTRFVLTPRRHDGSGAELVAMLAGHVASLIVGADPSLVKRCASSECTLWFLDRTKAHRRRFCSVSACGNREKVAAFRARRRAQADDS
jgi:predicted RNA-binding Zn ribbon-like protein